jgi:hypothetical protein
MAQVPYTFANIPNGSTIPLNWLDADFTYVLNLIGDGIQVVQSFSGGTTGLTPITPAEGQVILGGVLSLANGGTGAQSAAQAAINILPNQSGTAGRYLTTDGQGNLSWTVGGTGTVSLIGITTSLSGLTITNSPVTTSGYINISGTLNPLSGGTGLDCSQAIGGSLLIGNGSGFSLAQLTAGQNIVITNANGSITISAIGGGGGGSGVSSISGGTTGMNFGSGTGSVTMGGLLAIASGGTSAATPQDAINNLCGATAAGYYLRGNGTNMVLSTIQQSDITSVGVLLNNINTSNVKTQNLQSQSSTLLTVFENSSGTELGRLARAYGYITAGTAPIVTAGFNVQSVTHASTGVYLVTFTNTLPTTTYIVTATGGLISGGGFAAASVYDVAGTFTAPAANQFYVSFVNNLTGAYVDVVSFNFSVFV